ncbi:DnaJ family molecular chaperone [Fulvimarina sp. 2208YS6-2-32]|uniref:DnaJ family molecular chaperone n=1 Tax=Fulvimarina uroteuthidis TaxID=3098149 RepID=A0ABU5I5U7_9HYPH|nr:DnaJ family molecular chaperone [Fulvimarina sp. 2208YS6-2-32]MDY8110749.1 DnaJ family molecular chaperone [Fulvimarina sp. 2208YS6-2-32]
MGIFSRLGELLQTLAASGRATIDSILEALRTAWSGDEETRRSVAFSVAIIALSAKMAKADGIVTMDEVEAFREILEIPPEETRNVFRLYDIAKQDTAGYEAYAKRLRAFCSDGSADCPLLADVVDGLFHIAKADGLIHERELDFLHDVSRIFGLSETAFERMQMRHVQGPNDPYAVLGIDPESSARETRKRYLTLVRENHPDQLQARGVPEEFLFIATERMKAINTAYELISGKSAA